MRACVGGRLNREGTYVYIWLINFVVQQKLAQHCEAIILQFKKRDREKKKKEFEESRNRVLNQVQGPPDPGALCDGDMFTLHTHEASGAGMLPYRTPDS